MSPGLGQYLDGNAIRNDIVVYEITAKIEISLRSCRETYLYLFKTNLAQEFEELDLLIERHGHFKCLVAVSEINGTPYRCFTDLRRRPFAVRKID